MSTRRHSRLQPLLLLSCHQTCQEHMAESLPRSLRSPISPHLLWDRQVPPTARMARRELITGTNPSPHVAPPSTYIPPVIPSPAPSNVSTMQSPPAPAPQQPFINNNLGYAPPGPAQPAPQTHYGQQPPTNYGAPSAPYGQQPHPQQPPQQPYYQAQVPPTPPAPTPVQQYQAPYNPVPVQVLDPAVATQVQKHCKWTISSLTYDDIPAAIDNLEKALALLRVSFLSDPRKKKKRVVLERVRESMC